MTRITQNPAVSPIEAFETSTDASFNTYAGQKFTTSDGRELTLVLNGAVALDAGKTVQGPAIVANHQNITVVSNVAAGATTLSVTLGATLATANQYQGGFLVVNDGVGEGQILRIASNTAGALSTAITITLEDPVVTALTSAGSEVSLIPALYSGVLVGTTTFTNTVIGVSFYPVAADTYGLITSKGPVSCLADGAIGVGLGIMPSNGTAGAVEVIDATGADIGRALQAGVTTEYRTIYIDC